MQGNSLISMSTSYGTAKRGVPMNSGAFSEGYPPAASFLGGGPDKEVL